MRGAWQNLPRGAWTAGAPAEGAAPLGPVGAPLLEGCRLGLAGLMDDLKAFSGCCVEKGLLPGERGSLETPIRSKL